MLKIKIILLQLLIAMIATPALAGNGGLIHIVSSSETSISGTIEVSGSCDGDGGTVTIESGILKTNSAAGNGGDESICELQLKRTKIKRAFGTSGTGKGAVFKYGTPQKPVIWDPFHNPNNDNKPIWIAQSFGNGDGGELHVYNSNEVDFSSGPNNSEKVRLIAKGNGSGKGGIIEIAKMKKLNVQPPGSVLPSSQDIYGIFRVDGGDSADPAFSFGKITINGVTCEQWKTGYSYPATYWNCLDGNRSTGLEWANSVNTTFSPSGAQTTNYDYQKLQSLLKSTKDPEHPSVQIYLMKDLNAWNDFAGSKVTDKFVYGISSQKYRMSAAFQKFSNGNDTTTAVAPAVAGSVTIKEHTILHELGHQLDYMWGDYSIYNASYVNHFQTAFRDFPNHYDCEEFFTADTCKEAAVAKLSNNLDRYTILGYSFLSKEVFASMFAIRLGGVNYSGPPDMGLSIILCH